MKRRNWTRNDVRFQVAHERENEKDEIARICDETGDMEPWQTDSACNL